MLSIIYLLLREMAQSMPELTRHSPVGLHALLIRNALTAALVATLLGGVSLRSAEEAPVVWTAASIGQASAQSQSLSCTLYITSCPVLSITAAGGISVQDDVYAFTHHTLRGDGYLTARVTEIKGAPTGLAGLSIRASLTAGAVQLSVLRTASGGLLIRRRSQTNGSVIQTTVSAPAGASWLRLERRGQTVTLSQSTDGSQWAAVQAVPITLPESAFVGLAVTSQRPDAVTTATISNVRLDSVSTLPDGWTKVDLDGTGVSSTVQFSSPYWMLSQSASGASSGEPVSFVYQRVSGDVEFSARLSSFSSSAGVAGLMIRGTLQADSPYLWLRRSGTGARTVRRRQATGVPPTTTAVGTGPVTGWLKVVRQGTLLTVYHSADGANWTLASTDVVDLPSSLYVGLAVGRGTSNSAIAAFEDLRLGAVSANELPTISLTAPTSNKSVFEGDPVALAATASDRDDRVEAVEFFVDGLSVGVDTVAPYLGSWVATRVGSHQITASARDSDGAVVRTNPVTVTVLARQSYEDGGGTSSRRGGTTSGGAGDDIRGHDLGWHDFGWHDFGWHDFGWHDFGWHDLRGHDHNHRRNMAVGVRAFPGPRSNSGSLHSPDSRDRSMGDGRVPRSGEAVRGLRRNHRRCDLVHLGAAGGSVPGRRARSRRRHLGAECRRHHELRPLRSRRAGAPITALRT